MDIEAATSEPLAAWIDRELHNAWSAEWTDRLRQAADLGKAAFRRQLSSAFPGTRAPFLIGADVYPGHGSSLGAVAVIEARGERPAMILEAWSQTTTIRSSDGLWLAIPTRACPRKPNGQYMTPVEVDAFFNAELQFQPAPNRQAGFLYLDLIRARSGRGHRQATDRRLAAGRSAERVILFILTPQVTLQRRLDPEAAVAAAVDAVNPGS